MKWVLRLLREWVLRECRWCAETISPTGYCSCLRLPPPPPAPPPPPWRDDFGSLQKPSWRLW